MTSAGFAVLPVLTLLTVTGEVVDVVDPAGSLARAWSGLRSPQAAKA